MRKITFATALAGIVLATPAAPATLHNGLYGVVRKGPITPVCRVGVPCDAPAQVTLVFTRMGSTLIAGTTRSAADGRYRIALPRGYYTVSTRPRIGFGVIRPHNVHVRAGHFDRLNFFLDTGIR